MRNYTKKIWFRCLLACVIAIFAFFAGPYFQAYSPESLDKIVSKDGLADILTIVASSMLAVSIFSLSIIVQAFSSATNNASPRTNSLLMDNPATNNALGTFIGAFLFSITGLIGIRSNFYDDQILNLLFFLTIGLIVIIIGVFLAWINQATKLGRVNTTIDFVEKALNSAIHERITSVVHKCNTIDLNKDHDQFKYPLYFEKLGYIQYIDYEALANCAKNFDLDIYVYANPGTFVSTAKASIYTTQEVDDDTQDTIRNCFILNGHRTFNQDPRFGFIVLSEIALRAMSPAVNDPGTAVDILNTQLTSIKFWIDGLKAKKAKQETLQASISHHTQLAPSQSTKTTHNKPDDSTSDDQDTDFKRVYVQPMKGEDVLEDIFGQIIIDACSNRIVVVRLRKTLEFIQGFDDQDFSPHVQGWFDLLHARAQKHFHQSELDRIFN